MQLAPSTQLPDGLLAATLLLSRKPRHGVPSRNPAPHQPINERNCTAALGLRASLPRNAVRPTEHDGSYDPSNPQSFNRYAYVGNNPLSYNDPSGQIACEATAGIILATGGPVGPEGAAIACGIEYAAVAAESIFKLLGLFDGPSFHGSLKPRPNAQPWDEYNIHYGPNIAGALGLPDESCEFGACGGGMGFQRGAAGAIGGTILCQFAEPCGAIEDFGLLVGAIGFAGYDIYQMSKGADRISFRVGRRVRALTQENQPQVLLIACAKRNTLLMVPVVVRVPEVNVIRFASGPETSLVSNLGDMIYAFRIID